MIWLILILFIPGGLNQTNKRGWSLWGPCDAYRISISYRPLPENQNQYTLKIPILNETNTLILKFDSEVTIQLRDYPNATKIFVKKIVKPRNSYGLMFSGSFDDFQLRLQVIGLPSGPVPYVESILRDYHEICTNPKFGFLDEYVKEDSELFRSSVDKSCGRRKVLHTDLIVYGESTKSGDWPWHAAILRLEKSSLKYICGGTLLSKTLVLTAAHCAAIRGYAVVPDILSVNLGKHNLIGGDIAAQEREVFQVIIHPKFDGFTLDNDIALLKLKSEAAVTDYVQPACLWYKEANNKLSDSQSIFGTVVGWGFNHQNSLSSTLQKITIPIVPELTCLKSNPTFFHKKLNDNKLCAGFANGTSVCNGDSGGGLMIFVPDAPGTESGAWYVRGIVSIAPIRLDKAICDPNEYTIFTDVDKYRDWVLGYMN